jgi:hypothetical protein
VASDRERRFHANYSQLGFALKDKRVPDYAGAEAALSTAIDIRGPAQEHGWEIYELNRAICRIKQDDDFNQNRPSKPERQKVIIDDLKVAKQTFPSFFGDLDIIKWLDLNNSDDLSELRSGVPETGARRGGSGAEQQS